MGNYLIQRLSDLESIPINSRGNINTAQALDLTSSGELHTKISNEI